MVDVNFADNDQGLEVLEGIFQDLNGDLKFLQLTVRSSSGFLSSEVSFIMEKIQRIHALIQGEIQKNQSQKVLEEFLLLKEKAEAEFD